MTTLTNAELESILGKAENAGQGKWVHTQEPMSLTHFIEIKVKHYDGETMFYPLVEMCGDDGDDDENNAEFIASANPLTVAAICRELLEARARIEKLERVVAAGRANCRSIANCTCRICEALAAIEGDDK